MKKVWVYVCLLAFGVALTLAQWTPALAITAGDAGLARTSAVSPDDGSQEAQTFTGRISQVDGKFVLEDSASNSKYQLDDQDKAKPFEGKTVKVTGTLDAATNVIHVKDIQLA